MNTNHNTPTWNIEIRGGRYYVSRQIDGQYGKEFLRDRGGRTRSFATEAAARAAKERA